MAILSAHLLNGKIVGIETPTYSLIEHPFKIELNTPSPGYVDVSSVSNWWDYGFTLNRDFIYVRTQISNLIKKKGIDSCISTVTSPPSNPELNKHYYINPNGATGEWTTYGGFIATWTGEEWKIEEPTFVGYPLLNEKEKLIAANLKIGSQLDHFRDFGVPDIVSYGIDYHRKSIQARAERLLRTSVEVYNILPINTAEILTSLTMSPIGDVYTRYERFGVKGTYEDYNTFFNPTPTPGIADYIMARAPWDGSMIVQGFPKGIKLQNWQPIGYENLTDFCNHLYNILVIGDFDLN